MATYRLYCMDGAGSITAADWIEATDDADAIQQAHKLKAHALKCEVWQGPRLIGRFNPSEPSDES